MNQDLMEFFQEIIYQKIKDATYVINLDEYADVGTHWIALFCSKSETVEHIPREIIEFIKHINIKVNIFWVQAKNSAMYDYFCIGFIDFMLACKKLTDFTDLFSPHAFIKMTIKFWIILKMYEIDKAKLSGQD